MSAHDRIPESHMRTLPAGTAPPGSTFAPRNDFNVLAAEAYQLATEPEAGAELPEAFKELQQHHEGVPQERKKDLNLDHPRIGN